MIRPFLALAGSSLIALASAAQADTQPRVVPSPVEKVFVPQGFDDNDDTEIVLHGHFPNTCYKVGPVNVEIGADGKSITLEPLAYQYGGMGCAQVLVPFIQTAKLGLLREGTFQIKIKGQPNMPVRALEVSHAQSQTPDEFLYAPVESASVTRADDGQTTLKIEGYYPYFFIGCMLITEVKTSVTTDNVLVVQPIAEIKDDSECRGVSHKFTIEKPVGTFAPAEYLIHVRTLDGNSLNRFVDLTTHED